MLEEHVHHSREVLVELLDDLLRLPLLRERGEAADVGEQHRHLAPLPAQLRARRVGHQLVEDVLRDVAREQPLHLPLLAALDEVLVRHAAERRQRERQGGFDDRQPRAAAERRHGAARPPSRRRRPWPRVPARRRSGRSPPPPPAAHSSDSSRPAHAGAGFRKRPDSRLSMTLAWICMPGILPSENGTDIRSYRPGAVVPTTTIASLKRAGIDQRLLSRLDLLLRVEEIVERVVGVRRAAGLAVQHPAGVADEHPAARVPRVVVAREIGVDERHRRRAQVQRRAVRLHAGRRDVPDDERGRDRERRDELARPADERHRATHRAVRILHDEVVRERAAGLRQVAERRRHDRTALDPVVEAEGLRHRELGLRRAAGLGRHVHDVHDVAGARGRFDQRAVRLLAGPRLVADRDRPAVGLAEDDVVDDDLRRPPREVVDQRRVDHARPGPAADQRLEVPDAGLVDRDEDDVAARGRGVGGRLDPPVVGLAFDRLGRTVSRPAPAATRAAAVPRATAMRIFRTVGEG